MAFTSTNEAEIRSLRAGRERKRKHVKGAVSFPLRPGSVHKDEDEDKDKDKDNGLKV